MNEFVLKEKHKYWDNKITLEEYIKDIEESGYIDCTGDYEYEFWYILENLKKLNNLQSKIDKATEYIEKNTHNIYAVGYRDRITGELLSKEKTPIINRVFSQNPKELLKILKEAENVEDN